MASPSTPGATDSPQLPPTFVIPPPPPGFNYLAAIEPSLNLITVGTIPAAMLIPCLFALFLFSTKRLRQSSIFILNVVSVCLGIALGIVNLVIEYQQILKPLQPTSVRDYLTYVVVLTLIPFLVESILVLRLLAVYPISRGTMTRSLAIFIPVALLKLGRFINLVVYYNFYIKLQKDVGSPLIAGQRSWGTGYTKAEWVLQVIDNTFTSFLFLFKLRGAQRNINLTGHTASKASETSSFRDRLASLFWIATSNFVFPTLLSIIQLIYLFTNHSFLTGSYLYIVNGYVEIIGVLFATVWVSGSQARAEGPSHSYGGSTAVRGGSSVRLPTMQFASTTDSYVDKRKDIGMDVINVGEDMNFALNDERETPLQPVRGPPPQNAQATPTSEYPGFTRTY